MTTPSYTPNNLISSGITSEYNYTFEIITENDLDVYLDGVLQEIDTDYTVTGAGSNSGGTVVFTSTPAVDVAITFKRSISEVRSADFQQSGDFKSSVINAELDRLTMRDQELAEILSRSLKFSETSTTTNIVLPEPDAGKALVWNQDEDALENSTVTVDDIATSVAAAAASASTASGHANTASGHATTATTKASEAAASALAAAAAAASNLYSTIENIADTDSPIVPVIGDNGKLFVSDTTNGNIVFNLPSVVSVGEGFRFGIQKASASNTITVNRDGTDTINGSTSYVITDDSEFVTFIADDSTPDNWVAFGASTTAAGSGLSKTGSTISLDLTNDQTWTGSQRTDPITDNDGSFDMNGGQDFVWTPTGNDTLEFTNETEGQRGLILLDNSSGYTISLGAEIKADADAATTLSEAGLYQVSYWCYDGTNVAISYSGALA